VQMVAGGLPESTIIASMQANPTRFDVTPAALMELNKAHVTAAIMDAMVAAAVQATQNEAAEPPPQPHTARTRPEDAAGVEDPSVTLVVGDAREALPVERTQVAETTAKGKTLAELSRDKAVDEAVQAGMSEATERAAGSVVGSTVGQTAGGMLGGILSGGGRSRKVTYLWSVAGTSTSFTLPSDLPTFEASPGNIIGVRRDEYAPVLVKLTPLEDSPKSVLFLGPQAVADTTAFKDFQRPGFSYLSDVKNANQPLRLFNLSSGGISALMDSIATLPEVTDGNIDLDAKLSLSMFRRNDSGATRGFEAMVSLETGTQLLSKMVVAANEAGATLVIRDLACVLGMTSPLEPNDVTSQVRVRTGPMHLDQVHGRFTTTVQVDNISATSIPGPVSIILNEGPRVVLQNPSGYTCRLGSPGPTYFDLDIGTALDPGETATLTVTIAENDSPKLQLSPRVVCGPGPR